MLISNALLFLSGFIKWDQPELYERRIREDMSSERIRSADRDAIRGD